MTTETPTHQSHCPTCGMKLTRPGLSICSYCSAPLDLGGMRGERSGASDDATRQRLAKMREHKDWSAAEAWVPPEEPETRAAIGRRRLGSFVLGLGGLGLVSVLATLSGAWTALFTAPLGLSSIALLAAGTWITLGARRRIAAARAFPTLRRAALVTNRRSETEPRGGQGSTVYFFALELQDGTAGEFRFPGRGAMHDPLVPGNTGVAYTRRENLLDFKLIRV